MKRVVFRPEAEADLAAAAAFYDRKRRGLGSELIAAVGRAVDSIADAPGVAPLFAPGRPYRKYTVARFPVIIVFREQDAEITAIAVVLGRQGPAPRSSAKQSAAERR